MERESFNENFERFLRHHANSLKMMPSDKVWKNLATDLSKRRRRIRYTLGTVFLLTVSLGYYFVSTSIKQLPVTQQPAATTIEQTTPVKNTGPVITGQTITTAPRQLPRNEVRTQQLTEPVAARTQEPVNYIQPAITEGEAPGVNRQTNVVAQPEIRTEEETTIETNDVFTTIVDSDPETKQDEIAMNKPMENVVSEPPYTIESIATRYNGKKAKLQWQVSMTPTVSYRKLAENKSYMRDPSQQPVTVPTFSQLYNVKSAVTHKPDMGFEVGLTAKYPISNVIRLTGGVQFNVSRYDIKVFDAPYYSYATIHLNTNGAGADSVRTVTSYNNSDGYRTSWLENLYFQVSAPIGVELKLAGKKNTFFGVTTSLQPTYLLSDRAYLLTSDYKSYAEVPFLSRRWNMNTSFHAFVSHSAGKVRWQLGPQVRYQLLSSFVSEYPVKENLFDYGLRVGVNLNK